MKILLLIISIATFSCNSSKTQTAPPVEKADVGKKELPDSLPICVKTLIEKFQSEAVTNPPRKIYSYNYQGKTVYYVPPICCDQFSDLYNDSCRIMGHPDGGFTGRGDGKFKGFAEERTNERLLWQDLRK